MEDGGKQGVFVDDLRHEPHIAGLRAHLVRRLGAVDIVDLKFPMFVAEPIEEFLQGHRLQRMSGLMDGENALVWSAVPPPGDIRQMVVLVLIETVAHLQPPGSVVDGLDFNL